MVPATVRSNLLNIHGHSLGCPGFLPKDKNLLLLRMSNLFSIFDPRTSQSGVLALNWLATIRIFFLPPGFWCVAGQGTALSLKLQALLGAEIKLSTDKGSPSSIPVVILRVFLFVLFNNFFGLLPYVFTASRHPTFTCSLAVSSWLGYFVYSRLCNPASFFAHLVPLGTPRTLIPFMVLIELIRSIMRPLTLSVRLAANMVAGHLLLVLVSGPGRGAGLVFLRAILVGLTLLVVLELGVSFIQSYVFIRLSSLYAGEVQQSNL